MKIRSIPPANMRPIAQSANVYDSGSSLLAPCIGVAGVLGGGRGVASADTTENRENRTLKIAYQWGIGSV